jgi:hypothetical protein
MNYSAAEKLKEIEREVIMRRKVYPGLIARGSLSIGAAEQRIAIMQQIAEDYRVKAAQTNLFEAES